MILEPVFMHVGETAWSVLLAVLPLGALFVLFQLMFLRLPQREVARMAAGTLLAAAGLFLFLLGVGVGFLPFGSAVGQALGTMREEARVVLIGALLGFVTTWGEPAVRILADQVEEASSGSIRRTAVLVTVSVGVAVAAGVGLARIRYDLPLAWLVLPGYLAVLALMGACERDFVGIAIDAGGVAAGPLANTFLLALALGAAAGVEGGNLMVSGLGFVSLVALAPVISVMMLGAVIRWKGRGKKEA